MLQSVCRYDWLSGGTVLDDYEKCSPYVIMIIITCFCSLAWSMWFTK